MNDLPRYKLREIISRYGRSLCDDPLRCEGLLKDFCGQNRLEIFALTQALRDGIPNQLLTSSAQLPFDVLVSRFSKQLQDRCGMNSSLARWAVESWALALGLISEDQLNSSHSFESRTSPSAETAAEEAIELKAEDALPPLKLLNKKKSWFPKFALPLLFGFLAVAVFMLTKNDEIKQKVSPPSPPITKGNVEIKSDPSGAKCYFDSKLIGETPRSLEGVEQGKHFVLIVKEGHQEGEQEVTVEPGGNHQLVIQLKALPSSSLMGGLSIRSEPSGAECFLNDRPLGKTPFEITDLEQKTFQLSARKSGYRDWSEPVAVYSSKIREVTIRLEPQQPISSETKAPKIDPGLENRNLKEPITGMEFVRVPAGCYQMGCGPSDGDCWADEIPLHEVCLDEFWISKYEVTQGQWVKLMPKNPSRFKKGGNYPVEQVSWNEVHEFLERLNKTATKIHFQLPTEAEWEYAARGGTKSEMFAGGNDVDKVAWYSENSGNSTHPVGSKNPNGLGIYDMSGNVWEWCEDSYAWDAYTAHARNNPIYKYQDGTIWPVFRGGSWASGWYSVRTARKGAHLATHRSFCVGFRPVAVVIAQSNLANTIPAVQLPLAQKNAPPADKSKDNYQTGRSEAKLKSTEQISKKPQNPDSAKTLDMKPELSAPFGTPKTLDRSLQPVESDKVLLSGLSFDEKISIERACSLAKSSGPATYNRCLNDQLKKLQAGMKHPDLSSLSFDEKISIERACSLAKSSGPATYNSCLNDQLKKLQAGMKHPDLSSLSFHEKISIERACSLAKSSGPATYNSCLNDQLKKLQAGMKHPDLSSLSFHEKISIERACSLAKSSGPATYNSCLNDQLKKLQAGMKHPDLSSLSFHEKISIERACSLAKSSGPATYNSCLNDQLKKLQAGKGIH